MFIENLNRAQNMFDDDIQGVPYYTCMIERLPGSVPINRQFNSEYETHPLVFKLNKITINGDPAHL